MRLAADGKGIGQDIIGGLAVGQLLLEHSGLCLQVASGMAAYFSSRASTCLAMGLIFFSSRSEKLPKSFSTRDIGNTS